MPKPLTFDSLRIGRCWTSPAHTVTANDVTEFAQLTGDHDPLHLDSDVASQSPFGKPIAHGLLGLSLVAGLGSTSPRAATSALVGIRDWQFLRPVYFGDTVHAVTEILDKSHRGRRHGLVTWRRALINQHGETVQEGIFETLVRISAEREPATSVVESAP